MLPVCGFLSPGEKELERRLRQEPFARWIKTVAHGLPQRFDPTVEDSRFLADGRQLILSSFPSDVPVFPVNYDNCHLMNARNEALCRRATGVEEGFVSNAEAQRRREMSKPKFGSWMTRIAV